MICVLSGRPLEVRLLPTLLRDAIAKAACRVRAQGRVQVYCYLFSSLFLLLVFIGNFLIGQRLQGARGSHPQQGGRQLPRHRWQGDHHHLFLRQLCKKFQFSGQLAIDYIFGEGFVA